MKDGASPPPRNGSPSSIPLEHMAKARSRVVAADLLFCLFGGCAGQQPSQLAANPVTNSPGGSSTTNQRQTTDSHAPTASSATQGTSYGPNSPVHTGPGNQTINYGPHTTIIPPPPPSPPPVPPASLIDSTECRQRCDALCAACKAHNKPDMVLGHFCSDDGVGRGACLVGDPGVNRPRCNDAEFVRACN